MNITAETARTTITIKGATFIAPEPYVEGAVLTANEAAAMNQLLHENLRNNFSKKVEVALEAVNGAVGDLDMDDLQKQFNDYAEGYEFGVRRAGAKVSVDPVERELYKLAAQLLRKALKSKNVDVKTVSEEKFDELVAGVIERTPALREEAVLKVEAAKRLATISVEA